MKNQTKLNYATLHFAIDDLELINESLEFLDKATNNRGNKKINIQRLIWQLSQAINPELYESTDNALMNS